MLNKIKILVVDDEYWVRENMRNIIDWSKHGFDFLEPASDGLEAHEIILREEPNIVFTDVNMPHMTGIELAEKCAADSPETVFVAFSGYEDYKYVRGIMSAGAVDYLLKPVKPDELIYALNKAVGKLSVYKETSELRQINDSINTDIIFTKILYGDEQSKLGELELEHAGFSLALFTFPLLAHERDGLGLFSEKKSRDIKHIISESAGNGLIALFRNTRKTFEYILISELPPDKVKTNCLAYQLHIENICGAFTISASNYHYAFSNLNKAYKEAVNPICKNVRSIIPQIRDYIEAHYFEELTLTSLSEQFSVESTYLSKLFSNEIGETLMSYLTNKRIEKAKYFLSNAKMSVNKTSEAVGYSDYAYFGRVFKKITGLTPKQFRSQLPQR